MSTRINCFDMPKRLSGVRIAILGSVVWLFRYACLKVLLDAILLHTISALIYGMLAIFGYPFIVLLFSKEVLSALELPTVRHFRVFVVCRLFVFEIPGDHRQPDPRE